MIGPRLAGTDAGTNGAGAVTLAALAQDPRLAAHVPLEAVPGLLAQCGAVLAALAARMAAQAAQERPSVGEAAPGEDRWLTAEEADAIARVGVRWLYRHADQIPGAKRFSRRKLRFYEPSLRKWLRNGVEFSARRRLLCAQEESLRP